MSERELTAEDGAGFKALLSPKADAPRRGRPPTNPETIARRAAESGQPVPAPAAGGDTKALAEIEKPKRAPDKEQLRAGMRVICRLTWSMSAAATFLLVKGKRLAPLTPEEWDAWVEDSLGFARAVPSITLLAAVLGFPAHLFTLIGRKLVSRGGKDEATAKKDEKPTPALRDVSQEKAAQ